MRITLALAFLALFTATGCNNMMAIARTEKDATAHKYPPNKGSVCVLKGATPAELSYEKLGRIFSGKRSYGSVDELFPPMAVEARKIGAHALIDVQVSQRFKGPLPWRVTAPTGSGTAIRLLADSPRLECVQAGGHLY